ncbi:hypothetical protein N9L02_01735, partial [Gammaproteobacteria bacterium]|nr:hypothetical protein [Gammaproteobacteria bacterium]
MSFPRVESTRLNSRFASKKYMQSFLRINEMSLEINKFELFTKKLPEDTAIKIFNRFSMRDDDLKDYAEQID